MKKLKLIIPLVALAFFSCDNYLDINENPNQATESNVNPKLTLAAVQTASYSPLVRRMNELGSVFMNQWGPNVNSFTGGYAEEFGITMSNNFYEDIWTSVYRSTYEYSNIINYPSANYDNHKAIAKIMKSFYFQYLVDIYGDIPYSQAHLGTANAFPAYDDDQAIYRDLIVQLDSAINMINNAPSTTVQVGGEDVMLGGDMSTWVKFANTLKLRILLRQATKAETDAATATYLADQFAALDQNFINVDLTINPGYSNAKDSQQNPWINMMWELNLNASGGRVERNTFRFRKASDYIANELNNSADPRRSRLFTTTSGNVVGVVQGSPTAPTTISSFGPGLMVEHSQDGYVMLLAESLLLQAEAAHRGFISGDPQALFDQAIQASCAMLGVTSTNADNYIANINGTDGKGYAASTDKIQAIMYQKSIALCSINGLESWIEYTRTGYINNIPMPLGATSPTGQKPMRLMYPTSELASNSANVPALSVNQSFTTAPFWK
ncbi:SusD/RagB family nutrient-binding outer membrane lipoprotein [Flavobacterium lacisediminis]|uniref:SusD/RagB family nutrient-binding outer membrane lipoprotein n=1 Tax=Flavobacterium lacisediminis TaxID=2989705 RepID=A0ABT3EG46_9FLAO|nr:SusD/RagB family nutrient-binding outer membrane lipoprotein [Flavobacterium lacisediminis]MCW1147391.1 SusD/RagB family nutrient-binding outer membrane lipoprotein [Flavobacterium lacisediminis]